MTQRFQHTPVGIAVTDEETNIFQFHPLDPSVFKNENAENEVPCVVAVLRTNNAFKQGFECVFIEKYSSILDFKVKYEELKIDQSNHFYVLYKGNFDPNLVYRRTNDLPEYLARP